jgi:hypothetical protein
MILDCEGCQRETGLPFLAWLKHRFAECQILCEGPKQRYGSLLPTNTKGKELWKRSVRLQLVEFSWCECGMQCMPVNVVHARTQVILQACDLQVTFRPSMLRTSASKFTQCTYDQVYKLSIGLHTIYTIQIGKVEIVPMILALRAWMTITFCSRGALICVLTPR